MLGFGLYEFDGGHLASNLVYRLLRYKANEKDGDCLRRYRVGKTIEDPVL